jgi:surfeit locus 1 family protein
VYRKVLLKGRWDHEHTIFLGPRVRDGSIGFHLITPLLRENGSTVLVDRGFILKDSINADAHKKAEGPVEVLGLLRKGHTRNRFTPNNHPEKGVWHWVDLSAIVESAGGANANVQPVFVEEIFGKQTD